MHSAGSHIQQFPYLYFVLTSGIQIGKVELLDDVMIKAVNMYAGIVLSAALLLSSLSHYTPLSL